MKTKKMLRKNKTTCGMSLCHAGRLLMAAKVPLCFGMDIIICRTGLSRVLGLFIAGAAGLSLGFLICLVVDSLLRAISFNFMLFCMLKLASGKKILRSSKALK